MTDPKRYFMMRRFIEQISSEGSEDHGRIRVRIELECGCEVEREIDRSRLLETEASDGAGGILVPGKFVCARHSFEE